jgi:sensor histidine kinase YesM/streptogramin lyase
LYPLPVSFENKLVAPNGFHIDAAGIAWLGTWEDGLFRMDTRSPSRYTSYNPQGSVKKSIIDIIETDEHLWLGTLEGLQRVDTKTGQVLTYQLDPSQPGSLSSNHIGSVYHDRKGNLWIGTSNGINKASIRAKPFHTYQIVPAPPAFQRHENSIFSVLEDHYGTLWLSSAAKGLYRMDSSTHRLTRVVVNPADKRTMLLSQGWPLLEDAQGRLWVGTDMEKGLYQLERSTNTFIRHPCQFFVRMLDQDATGKLWVGGWRSEIASFDPLTKQFTYYRSDEKDSTSLTPGFIYDLMVSRSGEVWVATFRGLSRLNPKTGKFTRYHPNSHFTSGQLSDHLVLSLYEDGEGIIWVGTFRGGLNRLDPTTNTFTAFTTRHGLPSNRVTSIMGDQQGNLWLGTRHGLSRFNPSTNTFRNFDVSDGLLGNEFLDRGSVYRRNEKLFFGGVNGLVVFCPDSIKEDRDTFPVYITGVKVLEENRPLPGDTLTLTHTENFFSLTFAALNYTSPQKNRYTYQLEGVDKNWVYAGQQRVARYTGLGPGKYTFRVKATTDERVWNKQEARLTIIIYPPWWRTFWAYGFYFLCLLAGMFAVDRFQRRKLISREREKARERELAQAREIEQANQELALQKEELESTLEHLKATQTQLVEQEKAALENKHKLERAAYQNKMAELEMQALRAQMNPHFIFNSLNSINRFILKNQSEAASDYLTKFSRLIRLILLNSQSQAVPLENELEALKLYLEMEESRFEGRFHFQINTDTDLEIEDLEVPPLIIQPYVENAIWHGLMHKEGQGHLSIELHRENGTLLCQITDDGIGRKRAAELKSKSASKGKSLGMQITSHRLALINSLHEKETTVQIIDLVDPAGEALGTRVVLKIPV